MQRRHLLVASAASLGVVRSAWAHHGWSSFDQDRPIYLAGKVIRSRWQNPHAELVIEVPSDLKLPADLAKRAVPAQSAGVDGPGVLAKATTPKRTDRQWELELAPLTRMGAWKVAEIPVGAAVSAVGFTFTGSRATP